MKFKKGFDPAFLGAVGWGSKLEPFYAYTSEGIIIVDAGGISYYAFDEFDSYGNMKGWNNQKPIENFSDAVLIVFALEELDLDKFVEYIKLTYTEGM